MITADWIALGLIAVFCLLGVLAGFGRGLKFFTSGIFGIIISVFICYCLGGLIYNITIVRELLDKLIVALQDKNGFCDFLISIRLDLIVYYVALFIIVSIIRIVIVKIIKSIAETKNVVFRVINKTLGVVFFIAVLIIFTLVVFHVISLIGGSTAEDFLFKLEGSKLKLDYIFQHNPLMSIFN